MEEAILDKKDRNGIEQQQQQTEMGVFSSKVQVENQWTGGNAYLCITGIPMQMCLSCVRSAHINLYLLLFHCFLYITHCYRIALSFRERAQRASSQKVGEGNPFHFLH